MIETEEGTKTIPNSSTNDLSCPACDGKGYGFFNYINSGGLYANHITLTCRWCMGTGKTLWPNW